MICIHTYIEERSKRPKKKAIASTSTPDINFTLTPPIMEEITDKDLEAIFSETNAHEEVITLREEASGRTRSFLKV